jgi:hypothetical protein
LSGFPISMIATTTVSAALADWRQQTRFLIGRRPVRARHRRHPVLVVRKLSRLQAAAGWKSSASTPPSTT